MVSRLYLHHRLRWKFHELQFGMHGSDTNTCGFPPGLQLGYSGLWNMLELIWQVKERKKKGKKMNLGIKDV